MIFHSLFCSKKFFFKFLCFQKEKTMKIFLNTYPNNTNFNGRLPYPKEFLDKTIKSYVDENVPAKIIHAKTGLSLNTIAKWV